MLIHDLKELDGNLPVVLHIPSIAWHQDGSITRAAEVKGHCVIYTGNMPSFSMMIDNRPKITVAQLLEQIEKLGIPTFIFPTCLAVARLVESDGDLIADGHGTYLHPKEKVILEASEHNHEDCDRKA